MTTNPRTATHEEPSAGAVVPSGTLLKLSTKEIVPSRSNPRRLFDRPELDSLKANIRQHGVLVPITVFRPKGQKTYSILDGERRHRCCVELEREGRSLSIPANLVEPPTKVAGLLYMFSIHNFREAWELMPTALALRTVMEALGQQDNAELEKLTGLSEPQIERCKVLLGFPEKYQKLSLDPDPDARIPSNFWIELKPVLDLCEQELPALVKKLTRDGVIDALVAKYHAKKIKSVIHFRRIMEAYDISEDSERRRPVLDRLKQYVETRDLETRDAFDEFVVDNRRIVRAVDACNEFLKVLQRLKLDYTIDREDLRRALRKVLAFAQKLLNKLEGGDEPREE